MIKGAMRNRSLNSKFGGKELQNNAAEIVFRLTYLYHLPDPRNRANWIVCQNSSISFVGLITYTHNKLNSIPNLSRVKYNLLVKTKGQSLNPAVGVTLSPSISLFISNTHTWCF